MAVALSQALWGLIAPHLSSNLESEMSISRQVESAGLGRPGSGGLGWRIGVAISHDFVLARTGPERQVSAEFKPKAPFPGFVFPPMTLSQSDC